VGGAGGHYQGDSTLLCLLLVVERLQFNQLMTISAMFNINGTRITLSPHRACFEPGWVSHT